MRFGLIFIAFCALTGPSLSALIIRDPTEMLRSVGFHVRGDERQEWLRAVNKLQSGMEQGLPIAEFNARRSEIASSAALVVLMERLPSGSEFEKDNNEVLQSLSRTNLVWKEKFPEYRFVCDLDKNVGWNENYCGGVVIGAVKAEGIDISEEELKSKKISLDKLVSLMMSSNSLRLEKLIRSYR